MDDRVGDLRIARHQAILHDVRQVVRVMQITGATAGKWRRRFIERRINGLYDELRQLTYRDALTGLANRRSLPAVFRAVQPQGATLLFFDLGPDAQDGRGRLVVAGPARERRDRRPGGTRGGRRPM